MPSYGTFAVMESVVAVEISNVTRRFGSVTALNDVTLNIARGEFFCLLGPSGCGKTTLLRIIAGLDFPDGGNLQLNGRDALAIPAHERSVNTVFQSYALFPHLNVRDNVSFGLRMKKVPGAEMQDRVQRIMALTSIPELADRKPSQLSGGQKQRVALARALVNEPQVLLLDEPLGALDLKLRKELQQELRALQRRTGVTFIHVTHDQDEALSMSDRIAVMNEGNIIQLGTPAEVYEKPRTRFVAQFLGGCNLLPARVKRRDSNGAIVETPAGELHVETRDTRNEFTLAIRPERVLCVENGATNSLTAEVIQATYSGAEIHGLARVGTENLRVTTMNAANKTLLRRGERIHIVLPREALIVLED